MIKTGAAGDVIRTTPLLRKLREHFPQTEITWISSYPDLIPDAGVDRKLMFSWENCLSLQTESFDLLINLDKSGPEASLAKLVQSKEKWGFLTDDNGRVIPANANAAHKWKTGIDDAEMRANQKHFVQETFEICGFEFNNETYWMNPPGKVPVFLPPQRPLVGLNTGCGTRWKTRLWPDQYYESLAAQLIAAGYGVVLLGGPDEDEKNHKIARRSGAVYPGLMNLKNFTNLVEKCDVVVTSVTMALHIAIARGKRIVLLNNIFPTNEFYLYGLGEILEPKLACQSCYKNDFDDQCPTAPCLSLVTTDHVFSAVERQIAVVLESPLEPRKGTQLT